MNRNPSAARYAPWLARDVARGPGVLFLVVTVALAIIFWRIKQRGGAVPPTETILAQTMSQVMLIASLIAVGGIVSTDVHQGFYRAWFTKPMAPWWYYLQRWLLGGLAVMLLPFLYGGLLALLLGDGHGITSDLIGGMALGYLLYGSGVFLGSLLSRWDWLFVFLIATAQGGLAGVARMGVELPALADFLHRVLPPFHLIDPGAALLTGRPLIHVLAYGVAMLALALLLLVQRPLGSGGRA